MKTKTIQDTPNGASVDTPKGAFAKVGDIIRAKSKKVTIDDHIGIVIKMTDDYTYSPSKQYTTIDYVVFPKQEIEDEEYEIEVIGKTNEAIILWLEGKKKEEDNKHTFWHTKRYEKGCSHSDDRCINHKVRSSLLDELIKEA